ncbi:transporter substrate-binding domain-containing protein [Kiloniella laminariae]|uniref:Transporter substrate-binding domain-containing protein n=1 Tax=Kiloniella laminariae TaxID=454162 RepID=A0ABT4LFI7_9PROT|nr:transporter substrate-binding domain-containing protein [Kiloniella laminariae]MCZ4279858.1 transporter substrate-binding domain-containing protein [Kiloniella laminariae]
MRYLLGLVVFWLGIGPGVGPGSVGLWISGAAAQSTEAEAPEVPQRSDPKTVYLTNGEWPPYSSRHLDHYGFFSRIVTEALTLEGYSVVYGFFPWKRSYELAKKGHWEGTIGWAPTEERQTDFYFSSEIVNVEKVFFHLRDKSFDWNKVEDLADYRLGVTAGYTYGRDFDQLRQDEGLKIDESNNDKANLVKLLRGRIDAFPLELDVGYYMIQSTLKKRDASKITHHPRAVMETPIAVAISRQIAPERADEILAALNRGLQTLRELGIYEKYRTEMMPRS